MAPSNDAPYRMAADDTSSGADRGVAPKACPTDLSIQCPTCGTEMQPEHAHYRCLRCGYRDSCCM